MKKNKRRILIAFLILLIVIITIFSTLLYHLHSTKSITRIITYLIERNNKDIQFVRFSIEDHVYTFPDNLEFKNIRAVFNYQNEKYSLKADCVSAYGLITLIDSNRMSSFYIKEGSLSSNLMKFKNVNFYLNMQWEQWIQGSFQIGHFKFKDLEFHSISSRIFGKPEFIQFANIQGKGYDGSYKGEIMVDLLPKISYSIAMEIDRLNLKNLEPIYPDIFSKINGFIKGLVDLKGQVAITDINAKLRLPNGGTVKAVLLQPLLEHIPRSIQKVELERLIQENGDVVLSRAECDILTVDKEKITTHFVILSEEYNLDIDLTVDLTVDGGIDKLFKYFLIFE